MTPTNIRPVAALAVVDKPRLRPKEAAAYLERAHGIVIAENTLLKKRCQGGGPDFVRYGRNILYPIESLDRWATDLIQPSAKAAH